MSNGECSGGTPSARSLYPRLSGREDRRLKQGIFLFLKEQGSSAFGHYSLFHLIVWIPASFKNGFFGTRRLTDAVFEEKERELNFGGCPEVKFRFPEAV